MNYNSILRLKHFLLYKINYFCQYIFYSEMEKKMYTQNYNLLKLKKL